MSRRLTDHERACRALSERDFQWAYTKTLRELSFKVAHHYDSRFSDQGTRGFPDLTIVGHGVLWFVELKRELAFVKPEQTLWHDQLAYAGAEVWVHRPSEWDEMIYRAENIAGIILPEELRQFPVPRKRQTTKKRKPSTTLESGSGPSSPP